MESRNHNLSWRVKLDGCFFIPPEGLRPWMAEITTGKDKPKGLKHDSPG